MSLKLEAVDFTWSEHPLIKDCTFQLSAGLCWLRGPNGAGKTTFLRLLAGALPPAKGRISLSNHDSARDALNYRFATYWCNEEALLMDWLSVQEFAELNLSLYHADTSVRNKFAELMEDFALSTLQATPLSALSLGQGKKLLLAIGLALNVKLLLLDEPFNGLDAESATALRNELSVQARRARQIIVMTSHTDPEIHVDRTAELTRASNSIHLV